jgi:hypothetical protein
MKIRIDNSELKDLKNVIKTLNKFNKECIIEFRNGLKAKIVSNDLVSLTTLNVDKSAFTEFKHPVVTKTGINLKDLNAFLRNFKKYIEIEETETNLILKDIKQSYSLSKLEVNNEMPDIDQLDFSLTTEISFSELLNAIQTFKEVGFDYIELINNNNQLIAQNEQNKIILGKTNYSNFIKSKYPIEHLENLKPLKDFNAKISFSKDYPIKIKLKKGFFELNITIAPRVED